MIWFWVSDLFVILVVGVEVVSNGGCGSRCRRWWLVVVGVGSGSGFRFCNGLGFLMVVVASSGCEWWVGCFCLGEERYT